MFQVVGINKIHYTSKKTGEVIDGIEYHLVDKDSSITSGYSVLTQFLKKENCDLDLSVGDMCELRYTRRGTNVFVSGIYEVSEKGGRS